MLSYYKEKMVQIVNSGVGKRFLSMFLAVVMVLGILPAYTPSASAAGLSGTSATLTNGQSYTFSGTSLTYTGVTYTVAANANVTVTVASGQTVTINNQSSGTSPFVLNSGATLNLVVNGTLNVYGRNAGDGVDSPSNASTTAGGTGGYAGINVPTGTTLRVSGSGTLKAYGGDAGDGGNNTSTADNTAYAGGGGGAGAGIGGNGGAGGRGTTVGANGYAAGTVAIVGSTTKVYAYGGGGGSGGGSLGQDGGGGGGYPAAGIGGGGGGAAGGSQMGGAGFSTAYGAMGGNSNRVANGNGPAQVSPWQWFSGGYFEWNSHGIVVPAHGAATDGGYIGGIGTLGTPTAGAGGAGGTVYYVTKANVYAYNGSYITTSSSSDQGWATANQTGIYAQLGYDLVSLRNNKIITATWNASAKTYTFAKRVVTSTTATDGTVEYTVSSASASISKTLTASAYGLGIGTGAGSTEGSNGTIATANAPAAASGLSVAPNNTSGQLVVTWTTPANNNAAITLVEILDNSNNVVKSYSGSSLTTAMKTQSQKPSVTLTGLTNGTSYTYKIRVTNIMGNSVSGTASGTPRTLPGAPTGVTAAKNGLNGQLVVGWTTPANNGSAITKVEILNGSTVIASTNNSGGQNLGALSSAMTTQGQTPSVTVTGLTGGTTYNITVRVTNAAGSTTSSPAVAAVPAGPPLAPTGVTAEGTKVSGQLKVTWTTPDNNGADITKVEIGYGSGSTFTVLKTLVNTNPNEWNTSMATKGQTNTWYLTGLTDGTNYQIKVRAVSTAGTGAVGLASSTAYPYTYPGAPTNVRVERGVKQLTLSWDAAAKNGSDISKYEVFAVTGGTVDRSKVIAETTGTSVTITGLKDDTEYTYVVRATNLAGSGPDSAQITAKTFREALHVGSIVVTPKSDTTVTVSWPDTSDKETDNTPITGYEIKWTPVAGTASNSGKTGVAGSKKFTLAELTKTADGYTVDIGNFTKGARYKFTVAPVNAVGTSSGEAASVQTRLLDQPAQVEGVGAVYAKVGGVAGNPISGTATVSWIAPHNGGSPITQYTVYVYEGVGDGDTAEKGDEITSLKTHVTDPAATSVNIGGLTNGRTYFFEVSATNIYGESLISESAWTIPVYKPGRPRFVEASVEGLEETEAIVTWGDADANGSEILGYRVRVYNEGQDLVTPVDFASSGNQLSSTYKEIYTLSNGDVVTVSYTDNAGRLGHTAKITGLKPGTTYQFGVVAENTYGEDIDSVTCNGPGVRYASKTTLSVPRAPENVTAIPAGTPGVFSTTWKDPANTGGTAITKYRILIYSKEYEQEAQNDIKKTIDRATTPSEDDENILSNDNDTVRIIEKTVAQLKVINKSETDYTQWLTQTPMNDTGGRTYLVRVQAYNRIGEGAWSIAKEVNASGPPRVVEDVEPTLQKSGQEDRLDMKITWTDPSDLPSGAKGNGNSPITGYHVYLYQIGEDGTETPVTAFATNKGNAEDGMLLVARTPSDKDKDGSDQDTTAPQDVTIQGLEYGKTYVVKIAAINEDVITTGEGTVYTTPNITMWTLPSGGAFPTASPTNKNGELKVTWRTSQSSGDAAGNPAEYTGLHTTVEKYVIYYHMEDAPGGFTPAGEVDAKETGNYEYKITGLTNGSKYEVYVAAVNGAGETKQADAVKVTATPRMPADPPTVGLDVTSGNASAVLHKITAPDKSRNGGSDILRYRIYAQEVTVNKSTHVVTPVGEVPDEPQREVVAASDETGVMTDITIPDLVNGKTYRITVSSVNGAGEGEQSATTNDDRTATLVTAGMPEAPTNLTVEPGPFFTAVAEFTPANGNGSAISHYLAYVSTALNGPYTLYTEGTGENAKPVEFAAEDAEKNGISIRSGNGGQRLYVKLAAVNRVGESAQTEAGSATIAAPTTPTITELTANGNGVNLTWSASEPNGVTMLGYKIYYRQANTSGKWPEDWTLAATVSATTVSYTLPKTAASGSGLENDYQDLEPGKQYQVKINAYNALGESSDSNIKDFHFGVPESPSIITPVAFDSGELTVEFKAPADTGLGAGDNSSKGVLKQFAVYANDKQTPKVICELDDAVTGPEKPAEGETPWIDDYSWTDDNGVIHAKLNPTEPTETDDRIFWTTGTGEKTVYHVRLTGLANGSIYKLYATASNEHGESPLGNSVDGTPATTADAPRDLIAQVKSATEVNLSWRAPLYNGGDPIDHYEVKILDADKNLIYPLEGQTTVKAEISGQAAKVSGLSSGKAYTFQVYAVNKALDGAIAEVANIKTFAKPDAPNITSCRSYKDATGAYSLEVHWTAPENNGGTPITGYKVWVGASLKSGAGVLLSPTLEEGKSDFSFTITGLKAVSYTVRVEAFNSVCNSAATKYGGGTYAEEAVVVGKIAAPENFRGENTKDSEGNEGITLKWDAVNDEFSYYRIYDLDNIMTSQGISLEAAIKHVETQPINAAGFNVDNPAATHTEVPDADSGTHHYAIRCFNSQGYGGYLSEVAEITLGGAEAPELGTVEADLESLDVSFTTLEENQLNERELYGYQLLVDGSPYAGDVVLNGRTLDQDTEQHIITDATLTGIQGRYVTLHLPKQTPGKQYRVTVRAITTEFDSEQETTSYLPGQYETAKLSDAVWTKPELNQQAPVTISGDGQFTVQFYAANGMGRPIVGYSVFYGPNDDTIRKEDGTVDLSKLSEEPALADDLTVSKNGMMSITVDHVTNGTEYAYYLAAYTEKRVKCWSAAPEELSTITTGIPGAPEIISAVATKSSITVSYTEPEMDAALAVDGYQIEYTDTVTNITDTALSDGTSCTIEGLTSGNKYSVRVRARNSVDYGDYSESVEIVPGTPSAPEILDYSAGSETITVRWRAPQNNGSPLLRYRVDYTDPRDGSTYMKNVDVNLNSITLDHANDGIVNGVDYKIEIVAINSNGPGQPSQTLTIMPGTVPGTPREPVATVTDGTAVEVSWLEPADNGGLDIDYYQVTGGGQTITVQAENKDGETNYVEETAEDGSTVRRYTMKVDGLMPGESYQFGIQAHNKRDFGDIVETEAVTTFTAPEAPQWRGISSTNYTFTAMWSAPKEDGGSEILGYNVYVDGEQINEELLTEENGLFIDERGIISYTSEKALTLGASYEVSLSAVNSVSEGDQTSTMFITIQGMAAESVPGRPASLDVTAGNQQLTVTWTAPLIEGVVEGVTGYYIRYCESGAAEGVYEEIWHSSSNTELKEVISGLTNGTEYKVWVVANNRIGTGASSVVRTATPDEIAQPEKPANIKYWNNSTMNIMTITWDAVETTTQGGTMYYDVYVNDLNTPVTGKDEGITDTSYELKPVESGVIYKIWVVARNNGGTSGMIAAEPDITAQNWLNVDPTNMGNPTVNLDREGKGTLDADQIATKPTAPDGLNASVTGQQSIRLTWNTPVKSYVDENGEPVPFTDIEYYKVYVNGVEYGRVDPDGEDGNALTYDNNGGGLKVNTIYSFQVSAVNEEGEGDTSIPLQVFVPEGGGGNPVGLKVSRYNDADKYTKVHLTWDPPSDGQKPTCYRIQVNGTDLPDQVDANKTEADCDVIPNTNYVFRVWAQYGDDPNAANYQSKTTNAVNVSTVLDTPGTPTLTATENGGTINLSWTMPEGSEHTGYYLYVDNVKQDIVLGASDTSYAYTPDKEGDFIFNLSAVNTVAVEDTPYTKEGAKSETVSASNRTLADTAPAAPQDLAVSGTDKADDGSIQIKLDWHAVTADKAGNPLPEGTQLRYDIYLSRNDIPLEKVAETTGITCTYEDKSPSADGDDYIFRVRAVITGETESAGVMSDSVFTSTKHEEALLAAPTGLAASVNKETKEITLTWNAVQNVNDTLLGYAIYLDAKTEYVFVPKADIDINAPSYVYKPAEDSTQKSFFFQVAAVNTSTQENSMGTPGHSELSVGCNASLSNDISESEIPAAAAAPKIERSVHSRVEEDGTVTQNLIRVYWTAPTTDVEGKELLSSEISGYQINIAQLTDSGDVSDNYVLAEKFHDTSCYDAETGLWYYDIDVDNADYPINQGVRYAVTITATRSFMTSTGVSSEVPGAAQKPWIIMQYLNLDENGDFKVDKYPDSEGTGSEDPVAGTLVKLTATVTAGGNAEVDPTVSIVDQTDAEIKPVSTVYDKETGILTVEYRVMAGSANAEGATTYNIKITKAGCTYFELTDIPMITSIRELDLNAQNGGKNVELIAGDANGDGTINNKDLSVVKNGLGKSATEVQGDVNGDNTINNKDLSVVKNGLGKNSSHRAYTAAN